MPPFDLCVPCAATVALTREIPRFGISSPHRDGGSEEINCSSSSCDFRVGQSHRRAQGTPEQRLFPHHSVVSFLYIWQTVRREKVSSEMTGWWSHVDSGGETTHRAVVQLRRRFRMSASCLRGSLRAGALFSLLLRYTQALITLLADACARLLRWQTLSAGCFVHDERSDELLMTQVHRLLGGRRESVTVAAALQDAGLIDMPRISDRRRSARSTLACYS